MPQDKYTLVNEDRISRLPDDVISNILSCLPTVDAVGTCLLSKDWKDKWKSIYTIHIDVQDCENRWGFEESEDMVKCLVKGVEKLFQHVENVKAIFFRDGSVISNIDPSELKLIISRFLTYKAETLHIDLGQKEALDEILDVDLGQNEASVEIQGRLLSSATLKKLFFTDIFFKVPTEIYFPLLKSLHLLYVKISNETDDKSLKFTLPVLEILDIIDCIWINLKSVEIHGPCLQTLKFHTEHVESHTEYEDVEIKIVGATSLVKFDSEGDYPENILFIGSKIISASMTHYQMWRDPERSDIIAGNLLRECLSTLVELTLAFYDVQNFWKALLELKHGSTSPMFNKLERLCLSGRYSPYPGNTEALLCLLHAAPVLKSLVIKIGFGKWEDYDYDAVESSLPPSCVLSTLEEIKLHLNIDFEDNSVPPMIRLAKFLLQLGEKAQLKRFYCKMYLWDGKYLNCDKLWEVIISLPSCPPRFFTICFATGSMKKVISYRESGWAEVV